MQSLPYEIIFQVLTSGEPEDAIRQCSTNRLFAQVCSLQSFWETLYKMKFPYDSEIKDVTDWKQAYKNELDRRKKIEESWLPGGFGPLLVTKEAMQYLYELPGNEALSRGMPHSRYLKFIVTKDTLSSGTDPTATLGAISANDILNASQGKEEYYYAPDKRITLNINAEKAASMARNTYLPVEEVSDAIYSDAIQKIPPGNHKVIERLQGYLAAL